MGRSCYRICDELVLMPWRSAPGQHSHAARGNEDTSMKQRENGSAEFQIGKV